MSAETSPAPSTSSTHPPPHAEWSDEAPPPNPATAPGQRGRENRTTRRTQGRCRAPGRVAAPRAGDRPRRPRSANRTTRRPHRRAVRPHPGRHLRAARLIREFDEQEGWDGCLSCAEWLSWRAGLSLGAAREHVRVARALGELPKLSDAMRRGKVSYSKVRAVTRVATPESVQTLLEVALAARPAHVERIAPGVAAHRPEPWSRRRSGGRRCAGGCGRGWTRTGW